MKEEPLFNCTVAANTDSKKKKNVFRSVVTENLPFIIFFSELKLTSLKYLSCNISLRSVKI